MVRTGDDSGRQSLGHPRVQHEVADLGVNFHQIAGAHTAEFLGVDRIQPQRILVRNLIEKFGVARARVNKIGQPEDR